MFTSSWKYLDTVVGLVAVLLAWQLLLKKKASKPAPHPPGPKGLPVIGNVTDMPTSHEWHKFAEWKEQYGDIIYLNLLGQPMIVLNSAQQAMDMLEKKSSIYSDRPVLVMGGELVGWKYILALTPYGERFREYRRFIHKLIGGKPQLERFHGLEEFETHKFLRTVLQNPEDVSAHIRKCAGSIILKLSHGYEVQEGSDPIVDLVGTAIEQFTLATSPGAWLVDILPVLRHVPAWVPGAGFQKIAASWRKTLMEMADIPHAFVKERMGEHSNISNFTSELLENEKLDAQKEFNIKWSAASLYSGGADTTVSAIYTFFLTMTLFPEAQRRAQAEIDAVVGSDRLPSFEDRDHLPYVEAMVKEVLRFHPVAPLGVPHRLIEDDIHDGYLIKKGSIIMANIWQMLRDSTVYSDPLTFDPTRFLPQAGKEMPPDPRSYVFGFGRRICPGLHLADASMFISCAMTLAVFNISKAVREDGETIEPSVQFTSGMISHPEPFKCSITPRSAKSEALILSVDEQTQQKISTTPKSLPSSQYLLRVEQIALHVASTYQGAQFYLGCAQINVVNGGSGKPGPLLSIPGVYTGYEPRIPINIYDLPANYTGYQSPDPAVWQGRSTRIV